MQENGCTINGLDVHKNHQNIQQHHQNIQMCNHNLMLKLITASIGVYVPLHITYVPDIPYLTNISTTSAYNKTHPPTYDQIQLTKN